MDLAKNPCITRSFITHGKPLDIHIVNPNKLWDDMHAESYENIQLYLSENPNVPLSVLAENMQHYAVKCKHLHKNIHMTYEFYKQHDHLMWYLRGLAQHANFTWYHIQIMPNIAWGAEIAKNPNFTWDMLQSKYCVDYGLAHCYSANPNITWDLINAYDDDYWDWAALSSNPAIPFYIIQSNPQKPWSVVLVGANPGVTTRTIENNNYAWDYSMIFKNPCLTYEFIVKHIQNINARNLSSNSFDRDWKYQWVIRKKIAKRVEIMFNVLHRSAVGDILPPEVLNIIAEYAKPEPPSRTYNFSVMQTLKMVIHHDNNIMKDISHTRGNVHKVYINGVYTGVVINYRAFREKYESLFGRVLRISDTVLKNGHCKTSFIDL
jgi:hypothetical protein